jgi:hypothetical protein
MLKTTPPKDSTLPKCSPAYVKFVQQSRKVLGLPEKSAPTERLNPSLDGLMKEAFARLEAARRKSTS